MKKNWISIALLAVCLLILVALILNLMQGGVWIMSGMNGKSAYELAVENGYTGSLSDWLASLQGKDGAVGADGSDGKDGVDGLDGKSAYEIAVDNGFRGTLAEWLLSLSFGEDGKDGADGKDGEDGLDGSDGKDGADGVSIVGVYISESGHLMVRLSNGELIDAGAMGGLPTPTQKNDFQLAQEAGYSGTLHEWLCEFLKAGRIGDITRSVDGTLTLTLTDGSTVNAGQIGKDGFVSEASDAQGFRPRFEIVVMNREATALNLRPAPDVTATPIVTQITAGTELVCIGSATVGEDLFYRFWRNGQECYAKAKYFVPKYDMTAQFGMNLPRELLITADKPFRLVTEEIVPWVDESYSLVYSYSSEQASLDSDEAGILLTARFRDGSAAVGHASETETLTVTLCRITEEGLLLLASEAVTVTVSAPRTLAGITGLFIGDSRVESGKLLQALKTEQSGITFLGTRTDGYGNPCEGMGGWKAENLWLTARIGETENAFYSSAVSHFDFRHYMQTNYPDTALHFVVINLGANDGFNRKSVDCIEQMISSIHAYDSQIAVLVMSEYIAPAGEQPFFADLTRRAQFAYGDLLRERFADKTAQGIWLLPNHLSVDTWGDRILRENSIGGYEPVDYVHLGTRGYEREAGVIADYLTAILP